MEHLKLTPLSVSKYFFNVRGIEGQYQESKSVISEMQ
jgi:hypothetical protein